MGQNGSSERRSQGDVRPYPYDPPPGNNPELFLLEQEHKRERTGSFGSSRKKDRYVINKQEKFTLTRQRPSSESEGWLSTKESEKLKKLGNNNNSSGGKNVTAKQDKNKETYEFSPLGKSPRQGKRIEQVDPSPGQSPAAVKGNKKDSKSDGSGKGKKDKGRSKSFSNKDRENQEKEKELLRYGSVRDKNGFTNNVNNTAPDSNDRDNNTTNGSTDNYSHLLRQNKARQGGQQLRVQVVSDLPEKDNNEKNVLSKQDHEKERLALRKLESYKKRKAALVGAQQPRENQQNVPDANQRPESVNSNRSQRESIHSHGGSSNQIQRVENLQNRPPYNTSGHNRVHSYPNHRDFNQVQLVIKDRASMPPTTIADPNRQKEASPQRVLPSVDQAVEYRSGIPRAVRVVRSSPGTVEPLPGSRAPPQVPRSSPGTVEPPPGSKASPQPHQAVRSSPGTVAPTRGSKAYPLPLPVGRSSPGTVEPPPGSRPPPPPAPVAHTTPTSQQQKQWGRPPPPQSQPQIQKPRTTSQAVSKNANTPQQATHAHLGQHNQQKGGLHQPPKTSQIPQRELKKHLAQYTEIQSRAIPSGPSPAAAIAAVAAKGSPFGTSSTRSTPKSATPLTTSIVSSSATTPTPSTIASTSVAVPSPEAKKAVNDLYAFVPVNTSLIGKF